MSSNQNQCFLDAQESTGLSNQACAEFLGVKLRNLQYWRAGTTKAPEMAVKLLKYYSRYGEMN